VSSGTLTVGGQTLSTVEIAQRRAAAERFIEQSGSGTAVRALGELRRSPDSWFDRLRALASSDTTLKVALGVFMGVIAAEAALAVLRSGALDRLIAEIDTALAEPLSPAAPADVASAGPVPEGGLISLFDTPMASDTAPSPADQLDDDPDFDLGSVIDDLLS
jgi:hypothetical protein